MSASDVSQDGRASILSVTENTKDLGRMIGGYSGIDNQIRGFLNKKSRQDIGKNNRRALRTVASPMSKK